MKVKIIHCSGSSSQPVKDYIGQIGHVVEEQTCSDRRLMLIKMSDGKLIKPFHFNGKINTYSDNYECELVQEYTLQDYLDEKLVIRINNVQEEQELHKITGENYNSSKMNFPVSFPYYRMTRMSYMENSKNGKDGGDWYKENYLSAKAVINFNELKIDKMKKIVNYKCIKAYPGVHLGKEMIANNMCRDNPEYWEPQCEAEFKVGDWVVYDGNHMSGPYCLKTVNKIGVSYATNNEPRNLTAGYRLDLTAGYRLATKEEIELVQNIEIDSYKAEFLPNLVRFGCAEIPKELIKAIQQLKDIVIDSAFSLSFSSQGVIKVNDKIVSSETITKILNKLK